MGIFTQIFGDQGFNSDDAEPLQDFALLAPGDYQVVVEAAEVKPTKKNDGHYLEVRCQIVDGPSAKRKLWCRMNIINQNAIAQTMARSLLASLCKACGMPQCKDEQRLVGQRCIASVIVRKEQNEVREFKSCMAASAVAPTTPPRSTTPTAQGTAETPSAAPAAATGKAPWLK